MTRRILTAALMAPLALAACDRAKERRPPPDPFAAMPPEATSAPPTEGLSKGLTKRRELAGFSLDRAGAAQDPLNRRPAVTPADRPIRLEGFGFDPVAKAPAKGVDVVVDGKAYGTTYGRARQDVASYFKTPGLLNVGFTTTLPAATLPPGPHTAVVRVVATDGKGYYEGVPIRFEVK
ncbi:hypothetical protein [Phenylobacterium sp.]|uniref:hypothetical protein n=1 Tax=Phenylobacterium sp. TaxID=1871053 RepID=UPI002E371DBC|nr:hypothetical protein [Phenylobacterium sp.]HEX4713067.1 hypothetical protein [Phenylobacterium sp.]